LIENKISIFLIFHYRCLILSQIYCFHIFFHIVAERWWIHDFLNVLIDTCFYNYNKFFSYKTMLLIKKKHVYVKIKKKFMNKKIRFFFIKIHTFFFSVQIVILFLIFFIVVVFYSMNYIYVNKKLFCCEKKKESENIISMKKIIFFL
jgi:hypothetical protein